MKAKEENIDVLCLKVTGHNGTLCKLIKEYFIEFGSHWMVLLSYCRRFYHGKECRMSWSRYIAK